MTQIMQGDALRIPFTIKADDTVLTPSLVTDIEIILGPFDKLYSTDEIYYSAEYGWIFPLTQEDTMYLDKYILNCEVRVKFPDGTVKGVKVGRINVLDCMSTEVL